MCVHIGVCVGSPANGSVDGITVRLRLGVGEGMQLYVQP